MGNWEQLEQYAYDKVLDNIYSQMLFNPNQPEGRLISLPQPHLCFNIAEFYNEGFNEDLYDDLHACAKSWFKYVSGGERLYAVSWQHDGYSFSADEEYQRDEFGEWLVPVFPNGDYLFFLTKDFQHGIFADGIGLTISLFGKDMLEAFNKRKAAILTASC